MRILSRICDSRSEFWDLDQWSQNLILGPEADFKLNLATSISTSKSQHPDPTDIRIGTTEVLNATPNTDLVLVVHEEDAELHLVHVPLDHGVRGVLDLGSISACVCLCFGPRS